MWLLMIFQQIHGGTMAKLKLPVPPLNDVYLMYANLTCECLILNMGQIDFRSRYHLALPDFTAR
jgi:hypothetical protein